MPWPPLALTSSYTLSASASLLKNAAIYLSHSAGARGAMFISQYLGGDVR